MAECRVWDRKKWQTKRDEYNVPKGAARVSVGDALDKFHKDRAKGSQAALKACADLKKVLDSYMKAVAKLKPTKKGEKYKEWAEYVKKMQYGNVTDYEQGLQQEARAGHEYPRCFAQAVSDLRQAKTEFEQFNGTGKFKPTHAATAEDNLGKLIGWATTLANINPKLNKDDINTYRKAVVDLQGVGWTPNVMTKLATGLQGLPANP
jgi:hypothetical protein